MPYINQECRLPDESPTAETAGELNYLVSRAASKFIKEKGLSYQTFHDAIGALQDSADEIKRRFLGPHEDRALQRNGEVFDEVVAAIEAMKAKPS